MGKHDCKKHSWKVVQNWLTCADSPASLPRTDEGRECHSKKTAPLLPFPVSFILDLGMDETLGRDVLAAVALRRFGKSYKTPYESMALATFLKPEMLAPSM